MSRIVALAPLLVVTAFPLGCKSDDGATAHDDGAGGGAPIAVVGDTAAPPLAPPPFTAAEIKAATTEGRRYVFVTTSKTEAATLMMMRFLNVNEQGATVLITEHTTSLERKKGPLSSTSSWAEFVQHATYPAATTTIEEITTRAPIGEVKGPRYTFTDDTSEPWTTVKATFQRALPGAPARFEEIEGERVRNRMILLEHTPAHAGEGFADGDPRLFALGFLVGRWRAESSGTVTEETWFKPIGDAMTGVATTVTGNRDSAFEVMQIRATDAGLAYTAWPDGQSETTFTLVEQSTLGARFHNPEHDFPQSVRYLADGMAGLTAEVGTLDGSRTATVQFTRIPE